jgi:hypothetical protein
MKETKRQNDSEEMPTKSKDSTNAPSSHVASHTDLRVHSTNTTS